MASVSQCWFARRRAARVAHTDRPGRTAVAARARSTRSALIGPTSGISATEPINAPVPLVGHRHRLDPFHDELAPPGGALSRSSRATDQATSYRTGRGPWRLPDRSTQRPHHTTHDQKHRHHAATPQPTTRTRAHGRCEVVVVDLADVPSSRPALTEQSHQHRRIVTCGCLPACCRSRLVLSMVAHSAGDYVLAGTRLHWLSGGSAGEVFAAEEL